MTAGGGRVGGMDREACISDCGRYRYSLARTWGDGSKCVFLMLNPSTADAVQDDPTIRRCIRYAQDWGHGMLVVCNLFALRSTDPAALYSSNDPIGAHNDRVILNECRTAAIVVAAWGAHGELFKRGTRVRTSLRQAGISLHALAFTAAGQPRHPLYLRGDLKPVLWSSQ